MEGCLDEKSRGYGLAGDFEEIEIRGDLAGFDVRDKLEALGSFSLSACGETPGVPLPH